MGKKFVERIIKDFNEKPYNPEEYLFHYGQKLAAEVDDATLLLEEKGMLNGVEKEIRDDVDPWLLLIYHYFLQTISVMMVGHLGELYLSSTAIALSFCGVPGFSVIYGMSTALETLNGQAYGAQQYQKLGIQTYTALFCLILACLPLSLMWVYMGEILTFLSQDPRISQEAGRFTIWLVPALFGYTALQVVVRFFQTQSLIIPLLISSRLTFLFHTILSWVLVFKSGLANLGAALSIVLSYWLNVLLLGLYMKYSPTCEKSRAPVSQEIFRGIGQFLRLAIPSACITCLEWWAFEVILILSGLLPNPALETSVLSACLSTIYTLDAIPDGLSAAASTRVSNELGAENREAAALAVKAVIFLAVSESIIVIATLFVTQRFFGYAFSNTKEVVDYVTTMAPLCNNPKYLGAYVNLATYYICGIPFAVTMGFLNLRGPGLWMGIQVGAFLQTVLLLIITKRTNWGKQVRQARDRIFEGRFSPENSLLKATEEI